MFGILSLNLRPADISGNPLLNLGFADIYGNPFLGLGLGIADIRENLSLNLGSADISGIPSLTLGSLGDNKTQKGRSGEAGKKVPTDPPNSGGHHDKRK